MHGKRSAQNYTAPTLTGVESITSREIAQNMARWHGNHHPKQSTVAQMALTCTSGMLTHEHHTKEAANKHQIISSISTAAAAAAATTIAHHTRRPVFMHRTAGG